MDFETVSRGTLTLACADLDARPLFWTDDTGHRFGYEPAVADALANHLGLNLRWLFLQWSDFGPAVLRGEADAIWCGCAITPERQQTFLFSKPYALFNESVLVKKESGIRTPADLVNLRVGAITASTNMALAEQWSGCQRIGFDGTSDDVFSDMINALRRGDVDAVVDDEPAFGGLIDSDEFEVAFTVETGNRWGAAMKPDSTGLKLAIDDGLEALKRSGQLADTWTRWLAPIPCPDIT